MLNVVGADMPADMVYTHQRNVRRKGNSLGFRHAYQQCTYQTGSIGDSNSRNIPQCYPCLFQSAFYNLINLFDMLSGCDLRYNAPVFRV